MITYKRLLDLINAIYCNVRTRTKVDAPYLFRLHFPVKIMLVILPIRKICDCECQYPHQRGDWL